MLVAAVFEAFAKIYRRKTERYLRLATGGTGILPAGELPYDLQGVLADRVAKLAGQFLLKSVVGANRLERRREFLRSEAGKPFWLHADGSYKPKKGLFRLLHGGDKPSAGRGSMAGLLAFSPSLTLAKSFTFRCLQPLQKRRTKIHVRPDMPQTRERLQTDHSQELWLCIPKKNWTAGYRSR